MKCHRLVQIAVAKSMSPRTMSLVFHKLVFFLNASFPRQTEGRPLLDQWEKCDELASQVEALLKAYKQQQQQQQHQKDMVEPILLCEIICRCAWYGVFNPCFSNRVCLAGGWWLLGISIHNMLTKKCLFVCCRYFYERGQYESSLRLVDEGLSICTRALARGNHPGYSAWFVKDMTSHLNNVKATVYREQPAVDHGLELAQLVLDIRRGNRNSDPGSSPASEEYWISLAKGNLAVSLMGVDRNEEALDLLLGLVGREDAKPNQDIHLENVALCLSRLGRLEEAIGYISRAMESVKVLGGEDTARMAV